MLRVNDLIDHGPQNFLKVLRPPLNFGSTSRCIEGHVDTTCNT